MFLRNAPQVISQREGRKRLGSQTNIRVIPGEDNNDDD